jgi:hypothetical protein
MSRRAGALWRHILHRTSARWRFRSPSCWRSNSPKGFFLRYVGRSMHSFDIWGPANTLLRHLGAGQYTWRQDSDVPVEYICSTAFGPACAGSRRRIGPLVPFIVCTSERQPCPDSVCCTSLGTSRGSLGSSIGVPHRTSSRWPGRGRRYLLQRCFQSQYDLAAVDVPPQRPPCSTCSVPHSSPWCRVMKVLCFT